MTYLCPVCGSENCVEKDGLVRCQELECRTGFRIYQKDTGNKPCLRCGGTGKLETDMGVKDCHACCGTGTKLAQNKGTPLINPDYTEKQVDD